MRAPLDGGASQVVVTAPGISNLMCSRAPASICVFSQRLTTEVLFSTFDPMNGKAHEVARLPRKSGIENSALSPDGKLIAVAKTDENRIRLFFDCGPASWRNRPKKLEHFFFRGLGGRFERTFCYEQSDRLEVELAICRPGRQRARTLAGEGAVTILGASPRETGNT